MVPGRFDIHYYTGTTVTVDFTIQRSAGTPQTLTGMTVIFSMKRYKRSTETEILRFTQADSQLTVNESQGTVRLSLSSAETASLDRDFLYDLWVQEAGNGDAVKVLEGTVRREA